MEQLKLRATLRSFHSPASQQLCDWYSHYQDLTNAIRCLNAALRVETPIDPPTQEQWNVCVPLFQAALVSYRRCFTSGYKRKMRTEDVQSDRDPGGKYHEWIIKTFSEHIGHDVDQHEQVFCGPVISDNEKEPRVIGFGYFAGTNFFPKKDDLEKLHNYVRYVRDTFVQKKIAILETEVKKELASLEPKELYGLPVADFVAPVPRNRSKIAMRGSISTNKK